MTASPRPLSPHLQVYRPQMTSLLSITHRITGVALLLGSLLLVGQLIAAASGPDSFAAFEVWIGSWVGLAVLVIWSIAFFYHLANGIRHLTWDIGIGLDLVSVYRSGLMVLATTALLTVITWIVVLATWRA